MSRSNQVSAQHSSAATYKQTRVDTIYIISATHTCDALAHDGRHTGDSLSLYGNFLKVETQICQKLGLLEVLVLVRHVVVCLCDER